MAPSPKFTTLLQMMGELHDRKNHDYAGSDPFSNFIEAAEYAHVDVDTVFRVLLGIKEARLRELTNSGKTPNNESVWDTRMDKAMYEALRCAYFMEVK